MQEWKQHHLLYHRTHIFLSVFCDLFLPTHEPSPDVLPCTRIYRTCSCMSARALSPPNKHGRVCLTSHLVNMYNNVYAVIPWVILWPFTLFMTAKPTMSNKLDTTLSAHTTSLKSLSRFSFAPF